MPPSLPPPACAGGHGGLGRGGHFTSYCYCNKASPHEDWCKYPNALQSADFNDALVAPVDLLLALLVVHAIVLPLHC